MKSWLETQHSKKQKKIKIITTGPITSWQIEEKKVEDFIFLVSKITTDSSDSHELKDGCSLEGKS